MTDDSQVLAVIKEEKCIPVGEPTVAAIHYLAFLMP